MARPRSGDDELAGKFNITSLYLMLSMAYRGPEVLSMTTAQKRLRELRDRQSKERGRMAELAVLDELTDEQRSELDEIEKGTPDLERQIRAATVAVEDQEREAETRNANEPDGAGRERRALRSRASLTEYLMARMQGRMVNGAEAELAKAAETRDGAIPLELWDTEDTIERRQTDTVTGAPGTVGVNLDRIRPAVFANSIAPRLGIEMPRVMSGTYASATIATSLTAAAKAKGDRADATATAFTVTSVTPKRISARLAIAIEDVAAVGQANFESILRENLSLVLSDQLDTQVINGDGAAPNLTGIFQRLTDPSAAPSAIADFDAFAASHAGGVDGLWSNTIKDVSIVVGPATYTLASRTFQTATNYKGEMSAAAYAMANTGGFWTNKRMPDAVSTIQQAVLFRKGRSMMGGGGPGAMRTAVCPHWNEVSIDDIYTGSATGERFFTMHVLLGDVILVQPAAYAQISFKVA